jgi:hypothetical protein
MEHCTIMFNAYKPNSRIQTAKIHHGSSRHLWDTTYTQSALNCFFQFHNQPFSGILMHRRLTSSSKNKRLFFSNNRLAPAFGKSNTFGAISKLGSLFNVSRCGKTRQCLSEYHGNSMRKSSKYSNTIIIKPPTEPEKVSNKSRVTSQDSLTSCHTPSEQREPCNRSRRRVILVK